VDVAFVGSATNPVCGESRNLVTVEDFDSVSVTTTGRLNSPLAILRGNEPGAVLGRAGEGEEFVASVEVPDRVITSISVELHFPQLAIILPLRRQDDGMRVIFTLFAGSKKPVTRFFETIDVVFEEERESHCVS